MRRFRVAPRRVAVVGLGSATAGSASRAVLGQAPEHAVEVLAAVLASVRVKATELLGQA